MDEMTRKRVEELEAQIAELTHEISDLNEFNGYVCHQLHVTRESNRLLMEQNKALTGELQKLKRDFTYEVGVA